MECTNKFIYIISRLKDYAAYTQNEHIPYCKVGQLKTSTPVNNKQLGIELIEKEYGVEENQHHEDIVIIAGFNLSVPDNISLDIHLKNIIKNSYNLSTMQFDVNRESEWFIKNDYDMVIYNINQKMINNVITILRYIIMDTYNEITETKLSSFPDSVQRELMYFIPFNTSEQQSNIDIVLSKYHDMVARLHQQKEQLYLLRNEIFQNEKALSDFKKYMKGIKDIDIKDNIGNELYDDVIE